MQLVFFGNNWVGLQVLRFLVESGEEILGVVLHPPERRRFGDELMALAERAGIPVCGPEVLGDRGALRTLTKGGSAFGVSALFGYIFRPEVISAFPAGIVNLHPALLPYNRGASPDVWSIVDGTPAGATLHWVDAGLDTGDVIDQQEVVVQLTDTGATLYRRLEAAAVELFIRSWPSIAAGTAPRTPQPPGGSAHRSRELQDLDRIDLERLYRAGDLIDILRARTFPPYRGAYFEHAGHRVYLRLQLLREEDLE